MVCFTQLPQAVIGSLLANALGKWHVRSNLQSIEMHRHVTKLDVPPGRDLSAPSASQCGFAFERIYVKATIQQVCPWVKYIWVRTGHFPVPCLSCHHLNPLVIVFSTCYLPWFIFDTEVGLILVLLLHCGSWWHYQTTCSSNSGSFEMLHSYHVDCALCTTPRGHYWPKLEHSISYVSAVITVGQECMFVTLQLLLGFRLTCHVPWFMFDHKFGPFFVTVSPNDIIRQILVIIPVENSFPVLLICYMPILWFMHLVP